MAVPVIAIEHAKDRSAEPENKLSDEEVKVLAEIRIEKYKALERIKVRCRPVGAALQFALSS